MLIEYGADCRGRRVAWLLSGTIEFDCPVRFLAKMSGVTTALGSALAPGPFLPGVRVSSKSRDSDWRRGWMLGFPRIIYSRCGL